MKCLPNFKNNLKIVTWNANSIKSKLHEFQSFLYANDYDIVGICETKTDENFKLKISGYKSYLKSRNNRGGGVAILVKQNIDHSPIDIKLKKHRIHGH